MNVENYPQINFPFDKTFYELTKKEAETTFSWFLNIIPERIAILEKDVTKKNPSWSADFTRNSLVGVGEWVKNNVRMRTKSREEIELEIRVNNLKGLQAQLTREQKQKLSPSSERVRFDAGIYLAETLRSNIKYLEWNVESRKSNINYNSPVLIKTKERQSSYFPMGVLMISRALTIKLVSNESKTDLFALAYDIWHQRLTK